MRHFTYILTYICTSAQLGTCIPTFHLPPISLSPLFTPSPVLSCPLHSSPIPHLSSFLSLSQSQKSTVSPSIQVYSFHPRLFFTVDFSYGRERVYSLQFTVYSGVHLKSTVHCRLSLTVNPLCRVYSEMHLFPTVYCRPPRCKPRSLQSHCKPSLSGVYSFPTVNPPESLQSTVSAFKAHISL